MIIIIIKQHMYKNIYISKIQLRYYMKLNNTRASWFA